VRAAAVALLGASTNALVRLVGGKATAEEPDISPEELRHLIATHKALDASQREIISGALELQRRTLREVLVPRGSTFWLDSGMTVDQALAALAQAGHSRAPVRRRRDVDHVIGIAHWAGVLRGGEQPVSAVATPALFLPDTLRVSDALRRFKAERQQMAIVVDEYGSVDGIVTLEDLLEEVVGEIYDETDRDLLAVERDADGAVTLPGSFPLHDLPDLGIELEITPTGDYTTVAGLVMSRLGRVPSSPGDVVGVNTWDIEVLAVAAHAVTRVSVRPQRAATPEATGDPG
jgi:putative hemolysin